MNLSRNVGVSQSVFSSFSTIVGVSSFVWYNALMQGVLTRKLLEELYIKQRLSTWAIEKKLGVSRSHVFSLLKRYQIPTRTISESHIKYRRSDFSGDLPEKAYLTAFAIGDLRVRSHNGKRSTTISIGCGSTKSAQIKLIEQLFSKYGRVWKGTPGNRKEVNIEAFVNKSFSFLLPSVRRYKWCEKSKIHFLSFLAGFTDAEGSFFITNGQARVAWGNYNQQILAFIKKGLLRYSIKSSNLRHDGLKGYVGRDGYARKKNYWHLTVTRKDDVAKFLREIEPFLRHGDKKAALVPLRANLIMRGSSV